jgi:hypothetical protein
VQHVREDVQPHVDADAAGVLVDGVVVGSGGVGLIQQRAHLVVGFDERRVVAGHGVPFWCRASYRLATPGGAPPGL